MDDRQRSACRVTLVLLVGDAAGLAAVSRGEAIRPAVQSGLLAAQAILGAPANHRDRLSYALALEKGPGPRGRFPAMLIRLGAPLLSTGWFARYVVLDHMLLAPAGLRTLPDRPTNTGTTRAAHDR
jgi:flavin-dependent dehydrogenase